MIQLGYGASIVTGGSGFIGSHVAEHLVLKNFDVKVIDNLSSGNLENLKPIQEKSNFTFIKKDLAETEGFGEIFKDVKDVFHLAAYPEVRTGFDHPEFCFKENIENTFKLLEQIRKSNVETIIFTSSSTVYGEPKQFPTPESYGPLIPISPYGASKLACEALLLSYCKTYGINGRIFRFANIIGKRSNHGVIWDFVNKLKLNGRNLEILGDGSQSKSYLHISDCIKSIFFCLTSAKNRTEIFNIGNEDEIDVKSIAKIVCDSMNLSNVNIQTTGGVDNGRGWIGDVKKMNLDISTVKKMGWTPNLTSSQAVKLTVKEIVQELELPAIGS